jgi:hypothetical protein
MSRSHDISAELKWVELQRAQWRECAEQLHKALIFYAGSDFENRQALGINHSQQQNAALLFDALQRAFPEEARP